MVAGIAGSGFVFILVRSVWVVEAVQRAPASGDLFARIALQLTAHDLIAAVAVSMISTCVFRSLWALPWMLKRSSA
jgi:hypothetical protein